MELREAECLANELLEFFLSGKGWTFGWHNKKRTLGSCFHGSKQIKLSKTYTTARPIHEVKNTLLHEIAHALCGPGHGHDATWKAQAAAIGCDASRCADTSKCDLTEIGAKWVMLDEKGHYVKHWFRRPAKSTFDSLPFRYLTSRKAETMGKLTIVPYTGQHLIGR